MVQPKDFSESLSARYVGFCAVAPDSLPANFCAYIDDHDGHGQHLISVNDGNALALAMCYHNGTSKVAIVYMQNSGLGNTLNPLISLADLEGHQVPILLFIGWRGEPGVNDEQQHVKQGRVTLGELYFMEIPNWVLYSDIDVDVTLYATFGSIQERNAPVALAVHKDTFANDLPNLYQAWASVIDKTGTELLEVKIKNGSCDDLGRPTTTDDQNKPAFMEAASV